ncbi:ribbon-helix-helix domain-containing protein [Hyperthermus butylicus]|uniref:Ribbon-helix-helix protein CopG domain-containing protein n=1 Tax=Hyperthermus butylicus (strain DSM 5456 / JCM 9403 / PLM1-5) TaxID=415426 RepID=A2BM81_HYPBU|nr:ribbon-helix-helix domain-containing protein [Hyperthermus butylicus]ABM81092.1 hypothetical protein Hbut_1260 [Hyperthermus butylicus DSM 5456]
MARQPSDTQIIDVVVPSPKKVVSVKLEVEIIEELDRTWRALGYTSRSEFIREAILYYMQVVQARRAATSAAIRGDNMGRVLANGEAGAEEVEEEEFVEEEGVV